jgi:tetratricopeptide (TPR) repeat protein
MARPGPVAALCAVLVAVAGADAMPEAQSLGALLQRWTAAVQAHRPGEADEPVVSLARWPDADFFDVRGAVIRVVDRHRRGLPLEFEGGILGVRDAASINRLLKRAAVLHADIARLASPIDARPGPLRRGASGAVPVDDGEAARVRRDAIHWSFGQSLLQHVLPDAAADPFVPLWHRAAVAHQLHALEFNYALPQLAAVLRLLPNDPVLLRYAGSAHEHMASGTVQASLKDLDLPDGFGTAIGSVDAELRAAKALLDRAVAADPGSAEARLRLGRVLTLLGDADRAAAELTRASADATARQHQYYAALFLGRAEELRGRVEAARVAFERAAALYPRATSPQLALSRFALDTGAAEMAVATVQHALTLDAAANNDPWWWYHVLPRAEVDERLQAMYDALELVGRNFDFAEAHR